MDTLSVFQHPDFVSASKWELWLRHAQPGDPIEYAYACNLDRDNRVAGIHSPRISIVPMLAWQAHVRGHVILVQKRLAPWTFAYIAIRTRRPRGIDLADAALAA